MVDAVSAADGGGTGARGVAVGAQAYLDALAPIMARVGEQAGGPVQEAADLVVTSLRAGGVLQAFGTGHSEALAMELAGRAGGLVPTNRISLRDVVIFGGEPPAVLGDGHRTATRHSPSPTAAPSARCRPSPAHCSPS
jgi:hypothetical protein